MYNNPLLIISAFLLFSWFNQTQIKENIFIIRMASASLGVYLIHASGYSFNIIEQLIQKIFDFKWLNNYLILIVVFPIISIAIYILSALIEEIRKLILNPLIKFINNNV